MGLMWHVVTCGDMLSHVWSSAIDQSQDGVREDGETDDKYNADGVEAEADRVRRLKELVGLGEGSLGAP